MTRKSGIFFYDFYCNNNTMEQQQRILNMTREQYTVQVSSAKKELRRLKEEVKTWKKELDHAIVDHKKVIQTQK